MAIRVLGPFKAGCGFVVASCAAAQAPAPASIERRPEANSGVAARTWPPAWVNLLGDDHFTRLQIRDHAEELGPIGAGTRGFLAIDTRDVIARRPGAILDLGLAGEVLFVCADAKV